ncbi:MAG: GGDEF domain-containing protein [Thiobacillus sp.]|nr:GGDEF domain-containing protein [Thiobacillus sp.]
MEATSPELIHEVLESIVLLTEQRDQRSLEHSLFHSLEEMLEGVECQVLEFRESGDFHVIHTTQEGHDLPDAILDMALDMAGMEETRNTQLGGMSFLLVNLTVHDLTARRVLVLWRTTWDDTDTRLALGMVRVYMNFTRLLFDSEKDTLTGLYNRKRLERRLAEITTAHLNSRRQEDRTGRGEYLALLDLDRFKKVNDKHGHLIGDEVLIIFANILHQSLRESDMCFRYGGEEFLILLQDVTREHAQSALDRIRHNVESHGFPQVGKVTVSVGFSAIDCQLQPASLSIVEADRALYFAKAHGRNQVRDYQALVEAGLLNPPQQDGGMELF